MTDSCPFWPDLLGEVEYVLPLPATARRPRPGEANFRAFQRHRDSADDLRLDELAEGRAYLVSCRTRTSGARPGWSDALCPLHRFYKP